MSKPTRKKSNGNGHKNGHSRKNGNGHKNGSGRRKKPPPDRSETNGRNTGMVLRRNSTTLRTCSSSPDLEERTPFAQRIENMDGSHVASAAAAGVLSSAAAVSAVAQGWLGPGACAAILMGTGAATAAYALYNEHDHLMMAGAGIASAGAFSMAHQLSVSGYEKIEKRNAEQKAKKAAAAAKAEAEKKKQTRNARLVILDSQGQRLQLPDDVAIREAAGDDIDEKAA